MATSNVLSTSSINGLVNDYITSEQSKRITPLTNKKTKYQNLVSSYSTLSSKLDSLKSLLSDLKSSATDSIYYSKAGQSSNTSFVSVSSSTGAVDGNYSLRTNQLAKNDLVLSSDLNTDGASTVITSAGTHEFTIKTGDGSGGEYTSKVSVTFDASDFTAGVISNKKVMQKIQSAVNSDTATITSSSVTGSTASSGSFVIDIGGTEKTITYSAGTYSDVIDSIVTQLNSIGGLTVQKVVDGSNYQLKFTVNDTSKYVTLKSDTGTLLTELGLNAVTKEKGAAGVVTASVFTPSTGLSQFSLTAKTSGYDYRITSLSDTVSNNALNSIGLNLGASRTGYVQNTAGADTPGYVYATTALNSKFEFNGINIERNSNTITDLITGTTVTLNSVMQATDTTVNVAVTKDVATIKKKIEDFITKFNDAYSYIKSNSKTSGETRGVFLGDATASSLITTFSNAAYTTVSGIPASQLNSLSKIGITFNIDSGLILSNSTTFEDAIKTKLDEVVSLFTTSTNGIAVSLYDKVTPYLGSSGYLIKSQQTYNNTITTLADSITSAQKRIDKSAEVLRNRYIQLQTQLAQLYSSQSYFMSGSN